MRFEEVIQIDREEAERALASGDARQICDALLRVTYHDPDWQWVQAKCIEFASQSSTSVQIPAVTCLGHLARIHGVLDLDKVLPVLKALESDPKVRGTVEDTLEDFEIFLSPAN